MTAQTAGPCTVCGRQPREPREYGERHYCDSHLAAIAQDVLPVWRASTLAFGVLVLLVVGLAVSNQVVSRTAPGVVAPPIGITVSLIPALAWIAFLYRAAMRHHIRLSPLLPTVLILSALVAAAVIRPVLMELVDLDLWLSRTTPSNRFLGNVLLNGSIHSLVLYALIRYTVWHTPSFTHRVDGILYALAASWGYGTMLVGLSVINQEGMAILSGGLRILSQLCAYLSPGLVIGYFLGRNRFEDMPIYYLSAGLALAAVANGLFLYAGTELNNIRLGIDQDGFSPWPGLTFSMIGLVGTYAAVYGLTRRHNALTRARLERVK